MKLRNIYITCKEYIKVIENLNINVLTGSNSGFAQVVGWSNASKVISEKLIKIKCLEDNSKRLINSIPEIFLTRDSFKLSTNESNRIVTAKEILLENMRNIIVLYESMNLNSDDHLGLDIKLPACDDFDDFKKYINDLEFVLYKCPLFSDEDENLKFESVDVGSLWLTFVITGVAVTATSIILNNIAAFIDKCIIIYSHKLTLEQQKKQVELMEMEEQAKKELLGNLEKLYKIQINTTIKELKETANIEMDGEEVGRTEQALEKMTNLLEKGMQIYATLDSADDVKALFEPLEMKYLSISNDIKLLETKNNEENKDSL